MPPPRFTASVFAALLGLGAGAGPAAAGEPAAEIAATRHADAVELTARAHSLGEGANGRYELVIVKRGGGGQSTVRQGGALPAKGVTDRTVTLARSRVSVSPGASLDATLRVVLRNGDVLSDRYRMTLAD